MAVRDEPSRLPHHQLLQRQASEDGHRRCLHAGGGTSASGRSGNAKRTVYRRLKGGVIRQQIHLCLEKVGGEVRLKAEAEDGRPSEADRGKVCHRVRGGYIRWRTYSRGLLRKTGTSQREDRRKRNQQAGSQDYQKDKGGKHTQDGGIQGASGNHGRTQLLLQDRP